MLFLFALLNVLMSFVYLPAKVVLLINILVCSSWIISQYTEKRRLLSEAYGDLENLNAWGQVSDKEVRRMRGAAPDKDLEQKRLQEKELFKIKDQSSRHIIVDRQKLDVPVYIRFLQDKTLQPMLVESTLLELYEFLGHDVFMTDRFPLSKEDVLYAPYCRYVLGDYVYSVVSVYDEDKEPLGSFFGEQDRLEQGKTWKNRQKKLLYPGEFLENTKDNKIWRIITKVKQPKQLGTVRVS